NPSGWLAVGGHSCVDLWNLRAADSQPVRMDCPRGAVTSLAFSPDGSTLAAGTTTDGRFDTSPALFEVPSGRLKKTLQGYTGSVDAGTRANRGDAGLPARRVVPPPEKGEPGGTGVPSSSSSPSPSTQHSGTRGAGDPNTEEWFVATPEGYFDCSANAARQILW